jgi:hypothetical protein
MYALRAQAFPRITRFDDRWRWLEMSVVPRFRRFDADARLVDASLRRIFDVSRVYASTPCILPMAAADDEPAPNPLDSAPRSGRLNTRRGGGSRSGRRSRARRRWPSG